MEFNEVLLKWRSIKKYKDTPVTDDQVVKVLEASRLAPSAMHKQPWHFIVVQNVEMRRSWRETNVGLRTPP